MTKKFISAGAGSGKTYTITNQVADMIKDGQLKAEQVIMTTFTKAAAQELREKAKKELNERKLYQEAQQMEHALIGTVHSVANTFLTKYWYLLGIMPDAAAMEEDEVQAFRDHSLRGLLKPEERRFLYKYAEDYNVGFPSSAPKSGINYGFWKDDLNHVLDYILWYDIDDKQLTGIFLCKFIAESVPFRTKLAAQSGQSFYQHIGALRFRADKNLHRQGVSASLLLRGGISFVYILLLAPGKKQQRAREKGGGKE